MESDHLQHNVIDALHLFLGQVNEGYRPDGQIGIGGKDGQAPFLKHNGIGVRLVGSNEYLRFELIHDPVKIISPILRAAPKLTQVISRAVLEVSPHDLIPILIPGFDFIDIFEFLHIGQGSMDSNYPVGS
jgi:hypothetical protein